MALTFLVEIGCLIAGVQSTLRYSWGVTRGYTTQPADTPASEPYAPRLIGCSFGYDVSGDQVRLGQGQIVLNNRDTTLDPILEYVYDSQTAKLLVGQDWAAYSTFKELARWTCEQPSASDPTVTIVTRSPVYNLDKPIQTARYGGAGGIDGGAELTDKPKPLANGEVTNAKATLVDAVKNIYQLSSGHDLVALGLSLGGSVIGSSNPHIYDQGVELTQGAQYTSVADMNANVPAAGQCRICDEAASGSGNNYGVYVRLGSTAIGEVTFSLIANHGNLGYVTMSTLYTLVAAASGSTSKISLNDQTATAAAFPYATGLFFGSDGTPATYLDALRLVLAGMRGWLVPYQGVPTQYIDQGITLTPPWAVRWLATPATASASPYNNYLLSAGSPPATPYLTVDGSRIATASFKRRAEYEFGWPEFRVTLLYDRLSYLQTTGLAGAVTAAVRARLALEYLSTSDEDASVKTSFPTAADRTVTSAWTSSNGVPSAEATRQLAVFKVHHPAFDLSARADLYQAALTVPGDPMAIVNHARYGCDVSRTFLILGMSIDYLALDEYGTVPVSLTVWG